MTFLTHEEQQKNDKLSFHLSINEQKMRQMELNT